MKIFVTGATGFIGSQLVKKLIEKNHQVLVLVRKKEDIGKFNCDRVKVIVGDITNPQTFIRHINKIDTLVHLAAKRANWGLREDFLKTNSESIKNLFNEKFKPRHIIITSSVYVFGKNNQLPLSEQSSRKATDIYGMSKIRAEDITMQLVQKYNIPYTIIRPAIVYGPKDNDFGMIIKMIKLVKSGKFPIIGSGENTLHLVYIDDLVEGYIKAIEKGGENRTYILASAKPVTLNNLIEYIKKELNVNYDTRAIPRLPLEMITFLVEIFYKIGFKLSPGIFKYEPPISLIKIRAVADSFSYDISKSKKELGFHPQTDYQEGIKKTVNWFLSAYK